MPVSARVIVISYLRLIIMYSKLNDLSPFSSQSTKIKKLPLFLFQHSTVLDTKLCRVDSPINIFKP